MNLMQKQAYALWFDWLGNKIIEWKDAKPLNKDLRNCIKAINEIGIFTNTLHTENEVLKKRIKLIREQKNDLIIKQQQEITDLKTQLKQYEI